jgi:hypothetical protein
VLQAFTFMRRFSCSQDARAAPADRADRVVPACRVPPRPVRLQPSRTRRPPEPQPVTVTGPPAPRVSFHVSFPCSFLTLFTRGVSSPLCETLFSHVFSAYSPPLFVTTHTQSNTDTTSRAPLAPSYYAPPSTITVHRFLRLRGRGCIRRNLCIREGVRIHTRCVYAPRARVNAPTCVYAPTAAYKHICVNAASGAYAHLPAYTHPTLRIRRDATNVMHSAAATVPAFVLTASDQARTSSTCAQWGSLPSSSKLSSSSASCAASHSNAMSVSTDS